MTIKYLKKISVGLSALMLSASVFAGTANVVIQPGTFTNLLSFGPNLGSVTIKSATVAATTATNSLVYFIDTPTNVLAYSWAAYTNRGVYATNWVSTWTNFYGVVQTNYYGSIGGSGTNIQLVDFTNSVPAGTNSYPTRISLAAPGGNTITYSTVNTYFDLGVWVTNGSSGPASVTINY